jgi:phospholipid/cholesterol/gamma-HCH transport system permease protein
MNPDILKGKKEIRPHRLELSEDTLFIKGSLSLFNTESFVQEAVTLLEGFDHARLEINLDELEYLDSIGVAALNHLQEKMRNRGLTVRYAGGRSDIQKKMEIFSLQDYSLPQEAGKRSFFEKVGEGFERFIRDYLYGFLVLMANVVYWSVSDLFKSRMQRKGEFYNQAVLIGVNAVWIVGGLAFIIGLVMALQSSAQLRNFGANIYIVDLTVIAMMSEMGPLITAIVVAGRSGSSIAAEVATMKVTSELDALKTMALQPVRFVVVPKMHGSLVTMPFLTIIANIMGILGGMFIAFVSLDISPQVFVNRMTETLVNRDIFIGIVKSLVFAVLIVLTGSFYGLRVEEGAEGVGKVTTTAVVVSITLVMVADSIMGLLFY